MRDTWQTHPPTAAPPAFVDSLAEACALDRCVGMDAEAAVPTQRSSDRQPLCPPSPRAPPPCLSCRPARHAGCPLDPNPLQTCSKQTLSVLELSKVGAQGVVGSNHLMPESGRACTNSHHGPNVAYPTGTAHRSMTARAERERKKARREAAASEQPSRLIQALQGRSPAACEAWSAQRLAELGDKVPLCACARACACCRCGGPLQRGCTTGHDALGLNTSVEVACEKQCS